jgi:hypothetical protein
MKPSSQRILNRLSVKAPAPRLKLNRNGECYINGAENSSADIRAKYSAAY